MKAISVEDVSKKFILRHDRPKNLADALRSVFSRNSREDFWALRDVNFEVGQGEAVGIIGPNGAGKSTMLKLLTRIMEPTKGHIRTRGRVSALIEIGAGFHPEMTGRENIYLNGSILGMTRSEIDRKFDGIVQFAGLEPFIDTPVKRYSTGMYARLGFSIAAHVNPDILLVDEVLSVGDAAFRSACAGRIRELKDSGITIIFVSHNMSAMTTVCSRVIGLWSGRIFSDAGAAETIARYRDMLAREDVAPSKTPDGEFAVGTLEMAITRVESISPAGEWEAYADGPWTLRVHYRAQRRLHGPEIGFRLTNSEGVLIARPCTIDYGQARDVEDEGAVDFAVPRLPLIPGQYGIEVFAVDGTDSVAYDYRRHSYNLVVRPSAEESENVGPGIRFGVVRLPGNWVWPG